MKFPSLSPLWPWAGAVALVSVLGGMQHLDEIDGELHDAVQSAKQERRKELSAASFCIKTNGPGSRPTFDAEDKLWCSKMVAQGATR